MFKKWLFIAAIITSGYLSGQETSALLGQVKDFQGEAVANAMVFVDGKDTGIRSNARGYFQLDSLGEQTQVITIYSQELGLLSAAYEGNRRLVFKYLDPVDQPENNAGDVNIGYGKIDPSESSYVVRKFDAKSAGPAHAASFNIYDLIRQRVPGLYIGRNNQVIVRGNSSLRGGTSPIFVVNGQIVYSIDWLPPNEVKTVELLTGPAASIYGTQGAGGVLVFTLKDGS